MTSPQNIEGKHAPFYLKHKPCTPSYPFHKPVSICYDGASVKAEKKIKFFFSTVFPKTAEFFFSAVFGKTVE